MLLSFNFPLIFYTRFFSKGKMQKTLKRIIIYQKKWLHNTNALYIELEAAIKFKCQMQAGSPTI